MATNHIPRLLRLARRTGDRLIVTDEAGGGEPMVILPLEEYEALIDQAFGPSSFADPLRRDFEGQEVSEDEGIRSEAFVINDGIEEEEADPYVELSDEVIAEIAEQAADEADIDEEVLKSLWQAPEEDKAKEEEKSIEKPQEVAKKKSSKGDGGEEGFYLEQID